MRRDSAFACRDTCKSIRELRQSNHRPSACSAEYGAAFALQPRVCPQGSVAGVGNAQAQLRAISEPGKEDLARESLCQTTRARHSASHSVDGPNDR